LTDTIAAHGKFERKHRSLNQPDLEWPTGALSDGGIEIWVARNDFRMRMETKSDRPEGHSGQKTH
jgi:hypothetical protein